MDDHLRQANHLSISQSRPGQLNGIGNEYWPKCGDALQLGVKAGWLIPLVDKRVGGGQNCVIPR